MAKIQLLDPSVAELIAAGEVVERPASVIKELVENAIDAGAAVVTVEIRKGGSLYIRVTDDGCGIPREEVPTAFLRHATSKVRTAEDLDAIGTLGFRGEALASVLAVARVEMLTRPASAEMGTRYLGEGSSPPVLEEAGCPAGTTLIIRDLFFNVPARMKFLKKDVTEGNAVAGILDKIALSHPEISFRLIRDGRESLRTPGDGKLLSAIYGVYKKEFSKALLPVQYNLAEVTVQGYISAPQAVRPNRSMQNFFINGRYIKSRTAGVALDNAFKGSIMTGKFPACILNLTIARGTVDVNVHPAKLEVRFIDEKRIFDAVFYGVKSALMQHDRKKEIRFSHAGEEGSSGMARSFASMKDSGRKKGWGKAFQGNDLPIHPASLNTKNRPDPRKLPGTPMAGWAEAAALAEENKGRVSSVMYFEEKAPETAFPAKGGTKEGRADPGASGAQDGPQAAGVRREAPQAAMGASPEGPRGTAGRLSREPAERPSAGPSEDGKERNAVPQALHGDGLGGEAVGEGERGARMALMGETPSREEALPKQLPLAAELETDRQSQRLVGELFDTYLVVEDPAKKQLVLIDKHAAHERLLYERLREAGALGEAQLLLNPVSVTLEKGEYDAVLENLSLLRELGFEGEDFGPGVILIRSIPLFLEGEDAGDAVMEIAGYLKSHRRDLSTKHQDWLFHNIACRAAVKGGDHSAKEELLALAAELAEHPQVRYCPHGRPVSIVLTKQEIEKQFGRIV